MNAREALDREMNDVLVQLALCSHVPAMSYQGRSSSGKTGSRDLSGGDLGPYEWERRYAGCGDDDARRRVVRRARAELSVLRRRADQGNVAGETLEQLKARIVKEGAGHSLQRVAVAMRCGTRLIVQARKEAGCDTEFGNPLPDQVGRRRGSAGRYAVADVEREDRIRQRKSDGQTVSQIAMLEGVHRSTVERALGLRAA